MGEGTVFSLFVSSHLGGGVPQSGLGKGGVLQSGLGRGGTPSQVWVGGYPISGLGRGVPHLWGGTPCPGVLHPRGVPHVRGGTLSPPPITQSSIASTCYAAGGVPLAFTQEDFLLPCSQSCLWKALLLKRQGPQNEIS